MTLWGCSLCLLAIPGCCEPGWGSLQRGVPPSAGRFCCQGVSPREEIFGEEGSRCCPHIWHVSGCKVNFSTALSSDNKAGIQHILQLFFLMQHQHLKNWLLAGFSRLKVTSYCHPFPSIQICCKKHPCGISHSLKSDISLHRSPALLATALPLTTHSDGHNQL